MALLGHRAPAPLGRSASLDDSDGPVVPATPGVRPHKFTVEKPSVAAPRARRRAPAHVDIDYVFTQTFGQREYRGAQRQIMEAAVQGMDLLVLAPTGLGKSLCFQVPALAEQHGITLVISPLLALMRDQIAKLRSLGVPAAALTSNSTPQDRARIIRDLRAGHPQLRLLYISAERLSDNNFLRALKRTYEHNELARLVVDEAHVITTWGETFRPEYGKLGRFRDYFPKVPIMALTASATTSTADEIVASLHMDPEHTWRVSHGVDRPNLYYELRYDRDDRTERCERIAAFLKRLYQERPPSNGPSISGIIYCRSRNSVEDVAAYLRSQGFLAAPYHRGLDAQQLAGSADMWQHAGERAARGEQYVDVLVATVAWGMGIDKPDVRYVVHYDLPTSLEGYYQESGRSGRDGELARCLLFYSREDGVRARGLVHKSIAQQKLGVDSPSAVQAVGSIDALLKLCESVSECRHAAIARYFGEDLNRGPDSRCHDSMCDICKDRQRVKERFAADLTPRDDDVDEPTPIIVPRQVVHEQDAPGRDDSFIEVDLPPAKKRQRVLAPDSDDEADDYDSDPALLAAASDDEISDFLGDDGHEPAQPLRDATLSSYFRSNRADSSKKPAVVQAHLIRQPVRPGARAANAYDDSEDETSGWEVAGLRNARVAPERERPRPDKQPPSRSVPPAPLIPPPPLALPRLAPAPPPAFIPFVPPSRVARPPPRREIDRERTFHAVPPPSAISLPPSRPNYKAFRPPSLAMAAAMPFPRGRAAHQEPSAAPAQSTSRESLAKTASAPSLPSALGSLPIVVDPPKYKKPIPREDREQAIRSLAARLCVALLASYGDRSRDEQTVVFSVLGLHGLTQAARHAYIMEAATGVESDAFWQAQTHQGYLDLLARRKRALDDLARTSEWYMEDRPRLERDVAEVVALLMAQAAGSAPTSSSPVRQRAKASSTSFAMSRAEDDEGNEYV